MNLIQVDSENNILKINDEAKLQRNSMILLLSINLVNAILNISKLYKEEFNFIHGVWIILGSISILVPVLQRNNLVSKVINMADIESYTYKKNSWNSIDHIIIHLKNKKKRYINIETKTQLEEIETLLGALNIPKNVKTQKNTS